MAEIVQWILAALGATWAILSLVGAIRTTRRQHDEVERIEDWCGIEPGRRRGRIEDRSQRALRAYYERRALLRRIEGAKARKGQSWADRDKAPARIDFED